MFKFLLIGLFGIVATINGLWLNQILTQTANAPESGEAAPATLLQIKTEMTGVPVVSAGTVSGYLVFQISSTVSLDKLSTPEFDVVPYILDAAIRASYQSTETGIPKFNAVYLKKLAELVREEANMKLGGEAILAVNVEQFNFVPKEEIRGNLNAGRHK